MLSIAVMIKVRPITQQTMEIEKRITPTASFSCGFSKGVLRVITCSSDNIYFKYFSRKALIEFSCTSKYGFLVTPTTKEHSDYSG